MKVNELLSALWNDYLTITPQAKTIQEILESRGEEIINDHIAIRTFNHQKISKEVLAAPFINLGYKICEQYDFEKKKLLAFHLEHIKNPKLPKVFISELLLEKHSNETQSIINALIDEINPELTKDDLFSISGRHWDISYPIYEQLYKESEYAAWVSTFGFRANHFTIFINALKTFSSLQAFNTFIKEKGLSLNTSGGEVKGSKEVFLEQSSTMASDIEVTFSDGKYKIPGCYYEFARRYPVPPDNKIYQGFVTKSADKIFESTNRLSS